MLGSVLYHLETHDIVEKAVQDVIAQLRKCKFALESRIKSHVDVDEPIIEWMIERSARILNCHLIEHDGKVPYRRVMHRDPHPSQVEFGEQVMATLSRIEKKTSRRGPPMERAIPGIWVGIHEPASENIVIIEDGKAIRTRTIFRRFVEERWNAEIINNIKSTPIKLDPSHEETTIPILRERVIEGAGDSDEDLLTG